MSRILVVEDNLLHAERLEMHLENLDHEVIALAENAEDALLHISKEIPEAALLDIQLDGTTDGIDLAKKIRKFHSFPILFTTSLIDDETIQRASEINPAAYLTKPIDQLSLKIALQLALKKGRTDTPTFEVEEEKEIANTFTDSLFVKVGRLLKKVRTAELDLVSASEDKYCDLYHQNGQAFSVRSTLQRIEAKLPSSFVRVHRGHICNMNNVERIDEHNSLIIFKNREVPIGKSYKAQVIRYINKVG